LEEEQDMIYDRQLYPRKTHNERGEPVFDMSPAKLLLREDVINHKHEAMTARELQDLRVEYWPFKHEKFYDRIRQEVRRKKLLHLIDIKRKEKLAKKPKKPKA
jgi:hypothetical protein